MYMAFTFIPNSPTGWDRIFLLLFWEKIYVLVWTCNLLFFYYFFPLHFYYCFRLPFSFCSFYKEGPLKWFSISAQNWNLQWHWRGYSRVHYQLSLCLFLFPYPPKSFCFGGEAKLTKDWVHNTQPGACIVSCRHSSCPMTSLLAGQFGDFYRRHLYTAAMLSRGTVIKAYRTTS